MYEIEKIESLYIEPTSYCNARCPQCDRFDDKNNTIVPLNHLNVSVLQDNLELHKMLGLKHVQFEGNCGDILNHYDPIGLATLFHNVNKLVFTTNGGIRNTEYFKSLAAFTNLEIIFSIDGLIDTNHLYRQNTSFTKIIDNAKAYINAGGKAIWKFIVFKHNEHQIDEAKNLANDIGFIEFKIEYTDRSWYHGNKWPVYNNNVYQFDLEPATLINQKFDLESDLTNLSNNLKELYLKYNANKSKIVCPAAQEKRIYIEHLGHVIPCCMLSLDFWKKNYNSMFFDKLLSNRNEINLKQNTLSTILSSNFYQNVLPKSLETKPMPKCLFFCYGGG
jgi:MoaA/NifB/PqqE/SkfB family radical SAM enzyme